MAAAGQPLACGEQPSSEASALRLRALVQHEDLYRPRPDYLEAVQRDGMSPQWRPKIMAWFDQLGDSFQLKAETLAMATNYLDRYLSRQSCDNVSFQLASIASIFLASKIEEVQPFDEAHPFHISDFVALSDGLFTASDLLLMELELLCTLKWHLTPPTVHAAAHLLVGLLEDIPEVEGPSVDHEEVADRACAYADKVRADAAFLEYPPSMVAVATVICALKATDAPIDVVQAWMARVEQVRLPYTDAPNASARIMKCGRRILELNGLGDDLRDVDACAADAEVEAAMQSEFTEATGASSSSSDDLSDRNSPSSVMEIDSTIVKILKMAKEKPSDCKIGANESSEASATPEDSTSTMVQWRVGDSVDYEVNGTWYPGYVARSDSKKMYFKYEAAKFKSYEEPIDRASRDDLARLRAGSGSGPPARNY